MTETYEKPLTARRVDEIFQEAMNERDLEKVMSLYDDNAVFVQEPGKPEVRGLDNIREVIREFQAAKPQLKVEVLQFVEADDVAFFTLKWEIQGTSLDGEEIHLSSYDGNVVKRQEDGTWKTIIDNPFHGHHIGLVNGGSSVDLIQRAENEVLDFHRALEGWLGGGTPNTDDKYSAIEQALAEEFSYVLPEGHTADKAATAENLRQAHGALGQDFRIWIRNFNAIANLEYFCLVRYEEWQRMADASVTGRVSTVVFRVNERRRNGVEWLHVHETWLPEESISNFSIPGE